MTTYTPPNHATSAYALLSVATNGPDEMMHAALSAFNNDVIALAQSLQKLALYYDEHFTMSEIDDIRCAFAQYYQDDAHTNKIDKTLIQWAKNLRPYMRMSLSALACELTHNYNYWIISPADAHWPKQLGDLTLLTDSPAPLCLWGLGSMDALVDCTAPVSIVGSRDVDSYGRIIAHTLAKTVALHGHTVISGGAMGADSAAHWGAISAAQSSDDAGRTVAIMAGGLDHIGPQHNATLFSRILDSDGAIISELAPHIIPEPYRFLSRNRLIAALGSVTIVAQAQHRSGALNTATWAADLNRIVLAAPGNINAPYNTGCNRLIYDGKANILVSMRDLDDFCHPAHDRASGITLATDSALNQQQAAPENLPQSRRPLRSADDAAHPDLQTQNQGPKRQI